MGCASSKSTRVAGAQENGEGCSQSRREEHEKDATDGEVVTAGDGNNSAPSAPDAE